jgi:DNA primase
MITNQDKERILEAARIEEVVGEFVVLKKRGSNLLGVCPFHNERTPSFTVSPAKGFYKCFGCGKAGDSVTFMMEHEHLTFPEALRYLAKKYNITIEEEAPSAEQIESQSQREALFVVTSYAQKHFTNELWNDDEGRAIGLSYFRERGFTDEIIKKFELGYAVDKWDDLTKSAIEAGYLQENLVKAGLTIVQEQKVYDRFRGRVIFPIHSLTGRPIAFGARILKVDPKSPKYLNSPETEIYYKSKTLYGISQAKKDIINKDTCFLVEGYTDVVSLHQAGVENVVASSGTALTVEQIRLIGRYTKNITVLYDGDAAGIKASIRGIDLILEEGMNVRVILFPDGDDPDSFSKRVSSHELIEYLNKEAVDFISFKTKLLLSDTNGDPIKKASLVRDIVETISKVPDAISRAAYLRQTSLLMEMSESVLLAELNKFIRKANKKISEGFSPTLPQGGSVLNPDGDEPPLDLFLDGDEEQVTSEIDTSAQEAEIIRMLLRFADVVFMLPKDFSDVDVVDGIETTVRDFIINELTYDGIKFTNEIYAGILAEFTVLVEQNVPYKEQHFIQQLEPEIKEKAITLLTSNYELSKWENKGIFIRQEKDQLHKAVIDPVMYLKKKQIDKFRKENQEEIKAREIGGLPYDDLMQRQMDFDELQQEINRFTNTVIQR